MPQRPQVQHSLTIPKAQASAAAHESTNGNLSHHSIENGTVRRIHRPGLKSNAADKEQEQDALCAPCRRRMKVPSKQPSRRPGYVRLTRCVVATWHNHNPRKATKNRQTVMHLETRTATFQPVPVSSVEFMVNFGFALHSSARPTTGAG